MTLKTYITDILKARKPTIGKPYSQQPGRQQGEGAGHIKENIQEKYDRLKNEQDKMLDRGLDMAVRGASLKQIGEESEKRKKDSEETNMFGETIEQFTKMKPSFYSNLLYATSILSDAQEVLSRGNSELARQFINKAKYFIIEDIKTKE